ncbi:GntR family transcriptional regulator [Actinomadura soli]|uniref:GntR family transcriptional regulator n=1 Tax=Actinomadura soli TaxID=2508997 RepID=UPI001486C974|nr:GntR family transcriptional regulator [Actinomadura soli]
MSLSAKDLAAVLRRQINDQELRFGETIPSQTVLARTYGVSVTTVNRALSELRREGLVRTEQGRGTVVTALPQIVRDARDRYAADKRLQDRGAFAAEIRRLGMTPRSETTIFRDVPPPKVAEFLGTPSGEEVVVRQRSMYADDTLVQIAPSYIPLDIAGGTMLEDTVQTKGGMISTMAQLGYEQEYADEYLTLSRSPTDEETTRFGIGSDQPVFELYHVAYANDRAVEVCVHVGPTHLWNFVYRVPMK